MSCDRLVHETGSAGKTFFNLDWVKVHSLLEFGQEGERILQFVI